MLQFIRVGSLTAAVFTTVAMIFVSGSAQASDMTIDRRGDRERAAGPAHGPSFWGDQRGCYWRRGTRFCSRYCYWEVDGRRYCHEKERVAHPQGDPWFLPYPPEPPIYLRPPHARP